MTYVIFFECVCEPICVFIPHDDYAVLLNKCLIGCSRGLECSGKEIISTGKLNIDLSAISNAHFTCFNAMWATFGNWSKNSAIITVWLGIMGNQSETVTHRSYDVIDWILHSATQIYKTSPSGCGEVRCVFKGIAIRHLLFLLLLLLLFTDSEMLSVTTNRLLFTLISKEYKSNSLYGIFRTQCHSISQYEWKKLLIS